MIVENECFQLKPLQFCWIIDKSFVDDIGQGTDSEAIAKAVITLGHSLSMQVMAEGVESEDQVAYLRDHARNEIHGYFYN